MGEERAYAAVDLGAGSGRVIVGYVSAGNARLQPGSVLLSSPEALENGRGKKTRARLEPGAPGVRLQEVHRFTHDVRTIDGHERWDFARILAEVERGLALAGRAAGAALRSVGVDGWGVDHGFLDAQGRLLADPISYRDARTNGVLARVLERVSRAELHARTGIQCLPINTSVQLFAAVEAGEWPGAATRLLMIPDLVHRHLCGSEVSEETNASTTQLLGVTAAGERRSADSAPSSRAAWGSRS